MRSLQILLVTLLTTVLSLSGCIDPAPMTAEPAEGHPVVSTDAAPEGSDGVREPFSIEWKGRLDAGACVVGAAVDTCEGVPSAAVRADDNPNSRHMVRHSVAVATAPRSVTVTVDWEEDSATGPGKKDGNPVPAEADFEFRISCSTVDREPCVDGRHTIAHAAGHAPTLVLEEIDLSWFDLDDHRLTWTFGLQSKEEAGLYYFPDTHVRFEVEGLFEVEGS